MLRELGPYMGLGWVLAVTVALGTVGGYFADRWLGTDPWLTLAGIAIGITAGFVSVLKTVLGTRAPPSEESRHRTRGQGKDDGRAGSG